MTIIILFALLLVWYSAGVGSFIYWWTNDFDFTSNEVPLAAVIGVGGPIAFMVGWVLHGGGRATADFRATPRPYIRKRAR